MADIWLHQFNKNNYMLYRMSQPITFFITIYLLPSDHYRRKFSKRNDLSGSDFFDRMKRLHYKISFSPVIYYVQY